MLRHMYVFQQFPVHNFRHCQAVQFLFLLSLDLCMPRGENAGPSGKSLTARKRGSKKHTQKLQPSRTPRAGAKINMPMIRSRVVRLQEKGKKVRKLRKGQQAMMKGT
jgi:hypothetical protein